MTDKELIRELTPLLNKCEGVGKPVELVRAEDVYGDGSSFIVTMWADWVGPSRSQNLDLILPLMWMDEVMNEAMRERIFALILIPTSELRQE